ncbi:hypothetical protein EHI45_30585 [Rhizobium leguminosarum]|uniref:hypothetical protein n=1 Tax=Rhizobium leguminosarum TaxID=384 RepID=UPI000FEC591E|nr:hypothetical protein [Rhizobium leguminosarum]RWX05146.1 hypothetical protein EHI45_30585 [Rhizobium leguminosarum]
MVEHHLPSRQAQEWPEVPKTPYAEGGHLDYPPVADAAIAQQRTKLSLPNYTLLMKQALEGRA